MLQVSTTAVAGTQIAADGALRNPTTQVILAHAGLTSGISAAPVSTLNVHLVATPDPVAPGQRVNYALTISNTGTSALGVLATATVPLNTTVAHGELSSPAYCDGVSTYTTCNAGQTLQFSGFSVPASGSVTLVYPALVSTTAAPTNGALLNSDALVRDSSIIDDYQVNVAAVAMNTALAGVHVTMSALPAQVRAGRQITYTLRFGNPGTAAVAAN